MQVVEAVRAAVVHAATTNTNTHHHHHSHPGPRGCKLLTAVHAAATTTTSAPPLHTHTHPQVRQHVAHKRTFLYLEQLILRAGADQQCVNIRDIHEGLDFFFSHRAHGLKLIDFLQVCVGGCEWGGGGEWGAGEREVVRSVLPCCVCACFRAAVYLACWVYVCASPLSSAVGVADSAPGRFVECVLLTLCCCCVPVPVQGAVPARFRADKQLVSHDIHESTYNYKYTFSVEIAPVCKVSLLQGGVDQRGRQVLGLLQCNAASTNTHSVPAFLLR